MEERIKDMFSEDIKKEISARNFELFDPTLDSRYRKYSESRINELLLELDKRKNMSGINPYHTDKKR